VELRLTFGGFTDSDDDPSQSSVVDVQHAWPADGGRIDAELVVTVEVVVEEGGCQVMGCAHGVEIAGEVEVDVLHGQDLAIAAARASALDPEDGPERRLPDGRGGTQAEASESLGETDRRRRLALSQRRGRDGRDDHLAAVRLPGEPLQRLEPDLGLVAPEQLDLVG
jgi:hypothetical protein